MGRDLEHAPDAEGADLHDQVQQGPCHPVDDGGENPSDGSSTPQHHTNRGRLGSRTHAYEEEFPLVCPSYSGMNCRAVGAILPCKLTRAISASKT